MRMLNEKNQKQATLLKRQARHAQPAARTTSAPSPLPARRAATAAPRRAATLA